MRVPFTSRVGGSQRPAIPVRSRRDGELIGRVTPGRYGGPVTVDTSANALLAAARSGDGDAFEALVAPHLRALHLHSYRMLGSYHDAEEAVQDTLLRAWKSLDG